MLLNQIEPDNGKLFVPSQSTPTSNSPAEYHLYYHNLEIEYPYFVF